MEHDTLIWEYLNSSIHLVGFHVLFLLLFLSGVFFHVQRTSCYRDDIQPFLRPRTWRRSSRGSTKETPTSRSESFVLNWQQQKRFSFKILPAEWPTDSEQCLGHRNGVKRHWFCHEVVLNSCFCLNQQGWPMSLCPDTLILPWGDPQFQP